MNTSTRTKIHSGLILLAFASCATQSGDRGPSSNPKTKANRESKERSIPDQPGSKVPVLVKEYWEEHSSGMSEMRSICSITPDQVVVRHRNKVMYNEGFAETHGFQYGRTGSWANEWPLSTIQRIKVDNYTTEIITRRSPSSSHFTIRWGVNGDSGPVEYPTIPSKLGMGSDSMGNSLTFKKIDSTGTSLLRVTSTRNSADEPENDVIDTQIELLDRVCGNMEPFKNRE
jgi:hypothetical protein